MIAHIKKYLTEKQVVQIPNLGSFSLKYKEAEIHPILHTFTPPGNYVQFKSNPKESDTEFVDYVAQTEGIEWEKARKKIDDWVELLKEELKKSSSFEMGSLGKFVQGAVYPEFTPALDPDLSAISYGLPSFTVKPATGSETQRTKNIGGETAAVSEPAAISKPAVTSEPTTFSEPAVTSEPATVTSEPAAISKPAVSEPAVTSEPATASEPAAISKPAVSEPAATSEPAAANEPNNPEPSAANTDEEEQQQPQPPHKRHIGRKILLCILILFLLCVICIAIFAFLRPIGFELKKYEYSQKLNMLFHKITKKEQVLTIERNADEEKTLFWDEKNDITLQPQSQGKTADTGEVSSEDISAGEIQSGENQSGEILSGESQTATEKTKNDADKLANSKEHYIIIGGFSTAENADKLVNKIKDKYPLAKNLGLNTKGTLHMVGIGPFTEQEAENQKIKLSATYKDCWIYKK